MQSQKKCTLIYAVLFSFAILLMLQNQVWAKEKQWIVFHDNIPQEAKRFNIAFVI